MDKFGLKVAGVDELETILPRRCDIIQEQTKLRVEHALRYIADKIKKNAGTYDNVTIGAAELSSSFRNSGLLPCLITNPHLHWYLKQAGYEFEIIDGNRIMISWGGTIW